MDLVSIASEFRYVVPDGATPRSIEFELNPAPSLMRRALHLGLIGTDYDPTQAPATAGFYVDVEFYKAQSKLQTQRFCLLHGAIDPQQSFRYPAPPFFVLQSAPGSVLYDPNQIALLSGRSPSLTANTLIWPVWGFGDVGGSVLAQVLYTAPIEFTADIDRVDVRTVPFAASWIPSAYAGAAEPRVGIACAIVSKAM